MQRTLSAPLLICIHHDGLYSPGLAELVLTDTRAVHFTITN